MENTGSPRRGHKALPEVDVDADDDRRDHGRVEDLPEAIAPAVIGELGGRDGAIGQSDELRGARGRRELADREDHEAGEYEEAKAEVQPVDVDEGLQDARPLDPRARSEERRV